MTTKTNNPLSKRDEQKDGSNFNTKKLRSILKLASVFTLVGILSISSPSRGSTSGQDSLLFKEFMMRDKVKYDKKTGKITVNGKYLAHLKKEAAPGQLGINNNFTISVDGKDLIYMAFTTYPEKNAFGRPTGKNITYYNITFLESNRSSRKNGTMTASGAARLVAKNNLIVDGKIDPEAERKFHLKY